MASTALRFSDAERPMQRCTAASAARSTLAAVGRPTSSSAPTPWCSWARALRSTAGSTALTSEPLADSTSLRWRRSSLCAASSERRNSSCTHARALRSSIVSVC